MLKEQINKITDSWLIFILETLISYLLIVGTILGYIYLIPTLVGRTALFVVTLVGLILVSIIGLKLFLVSAVRGYRLLAPKKLRNRCRYTPTCSHYMIVSLRKHLLLVGLIKGLIRICRCRPPYGGIDLP